MVVSSYFAFASRFRSEPFTSGMAIEHESGTSSLALSLFHVCPGFAMHLYIVLLYMTKIQSRYKDNQMF